MPQGDLEVSCPEPSTGISAGGRGFLGGWPWLWVSRTTCGREGWIGFHPQCWKKMVVVLIYLGCLTRYHRLGVLSNNFLIVVEAGRPRSRGWQGRAGSSEDSLLGLPMVSSPYVFTESCFCVYVLISYSWKETGQMGSGLPHWPLFHLRKGPIQIQSHSEVVGRSGLPLRSCGLGDSVKHITVRLAFWTLAAVESSHDSHEILKGGALTPKR